MFVLFADLAVTLSHRDIIVCAYFVYNFLEKKKLHFVSLGIQLSLRSGDIRSYEQSHLMMAAHQIIQPSLINKLLAPLTGVMLALL